MSNEVPVSRFITDKGCVIEGVMLKSSEINYIYCPLHKTVEHVYSFEREIKFPSRIPKETRAVIKQLRKASTEYAGERKP